MMLVRLRAAAAALRHEREPLMSIAPAYLQADISLWPHMRSCLARLPAQERRVSLRRRDIRYRFAR